MLNPTSATRSATAGDLNDTSIVLRLTMGDVSFLLTGDITEQTEAALISRGTELRSSVLKVPHHGSKTSSSPAFLQRVQPWSMSSPPERTTPSDTPRPR